MEPGIKSHREQIKRIDNPIGRRGKIRLDKNECLDDSLVERNVKELVHLLSVSDLGIYPELDTLKERLAMKYGLSFGSVLLCHGSDSGIRQVFDVYARAGSKIIILDPTYAMYEKMNRSHDTII